MAKLPASHGALPAACLLLLLALACTRPAWRPGETPDAEELRRRMTANFSGIRRIELSWRAQWESPRTGPLPFRLDLDWSMEGARLWIRTPFGGELAELSCSSVAGEDPGGAGLGFEAGSSLGRILARAAAGIKEPALRGLAERGLESLLEGDRDRGFEIRLADERMAGLLGLLEAGILSDLVRGEVCSRSRLGPWLWGELLPGREARIRTTGSNHTGELQFFHGDTTWVVDPHSGLCREMRLPGLVLSLQGLEGSRLPRGIRITRAEDRQQLVLERRRMKLNRPLNDSEGALSPDLGEEQ